MTYVDGYVLPLKKQRIEDYKRIATLAREVWLEHGALDYRECIADDVQTGEHTSFPQSVKLEEDEAVVFAYITYRSRAERDACNAKVMADPRMECPPDDMPFDPKRMIFGGFETIVGD